MCWNGCAEDAAFRNLLLRLPVFGRDRNPQIFFGVGIFALVFLVHHCEMGPVVELVGRRRQPLLEYVAVGLGAFASRALVQENG